MHSQAPPITCKGIWVYRAYDTSGETLIVLSGNALVDTKYICGTFVIACLSFRKGYNVRWWLINPLRYLNEISEDTPIDKKVKIYFSAEADAEYAKEI